MDLKTHSAAGLGGTGHFQRPVPFSRVPANAGIDLAFFTIYAPIASTPTGGMIE